MWARMAWASTISIHSPRVGRGGAGRVGAGEWGISIHSPRVGRGARSREWGQRRDKFQSTRPGWGEANGGAAACGLCAISIHSPRVGRGFPTAPTAQMTIISIHSPRVGRGMGHQLDLCAWGSFQSTRPGWGEASEV